MKRDINNSSLLSQTRRSLWMRKSFKLHWSHMASQEGILPLHPPQEGPSPHKLLFSTLKYGASCYGHGHNASSGSLYHSILYTRIKVWGLIKSVKKGGLLLILGIETTLKGQVWTCMGALGMTINTRCSYPHWTHYLTTLRLWSCGRLTWCHVGGMGCRSRLGGLGLKVIFPSLHSQLTLTLLSSWVEYYNTNYHMIRYGYARNKYTFNSSHITCISTIMHLLD